MRLDPRSALDWISHDARQRGRGCAVWRLALGLAHAGVQVRQQRRHLLVGKAAFEGGHHASARKHLARNYLIGGGQAAGQCGAVEEAVQVRRDLLEAEVVVLVAVGATAVVEMLPFRLLRGEFGFGAAAGCDNHRNTARHESRDGDSLLEPSGEISHSWFPF